MQFNMYKGSPIAHFFLKGPRKGTHYACLFVRIAWQKNPSHNQLSLIALRDRLPSSPALGKYHTEQHYSCKQMILEKYTTRKDP